MPSTRNSAPSPTPTKNPLSPRKHPAHGPTPAPPADPYGPCHAPPHVCAPDHNNLFVRLRALLCFVLRPAPVHLKRQRLRFHRSMETSMTRTPILHPQILNAL